MSPTTRSHAADQIASYDENLSSLVQAALARVEMQQNADMRKISAWAALLAVPTMIAGIYGMNFEYMPDTELALGLPGGASASWGRLSAAVPQLPPQRLALPSRARRFSLAVRQADWGPAHPHRRFATPRASRRRLSAAPRRPRSR